MKNSVLDCVINKNGMFMEIIKPNEKYKQLEDEADKYYYKLKETLNKNEMDCFNNYIDTNMAANCEFIRASFKTGFKLGINLLIECLCDEDI